MGQYAKAAGELPDKSAGQPMPEPQKRVQNHRNSPTAFDGEALIVRMTGVRLTDVDGLGARTALTVLSETGTDLDTRIATEKHFAAWTTLAPRKHSDSVLGNFLRRLRSRLGPGSAIAARETARWAVCSLKAFPIPTWS